MANVPETTNVPWKEDDIKSGDLDKLAAYLKKLILHIQNTIYPDLANGINNLNEEVETLESELDALKTRYDAHTTHPPPA